jgi:hypothetical protein
MTRALKPGELDTISQELRLSSVSHVGQAESSAKTSQLADLESRSLHGNQTQVESDYHERGISLG